MLAAPAVADSLTGEPVELGNGTMQIRIETDAGGAPTAIAVSLTAGALEGLPMEANPQSKGGAWQYFLPMPEGSKTGYTGVLVDWNPHGHPPADIYSVPHFDFHFYTISRDDIEMISFTGPDDTSAVVEDKDLVAPDYQVVPDTVVDKMGVHAIDVTAPEFHGTPFAATFIYGYNKGSLIFFEPMVTRDHLLSKPAATMPVKTPARYSGPGYYPTSYDVRYIADTDRYEVAITGLKAWQ
ncbi:DUF5602 domain-containing protein [Nitratireductor sp. ZSWI3]|uniref:DUF5602 domain-containing protein n=1 Tax=Nitratireductor sp. ZSWI3 TaxID=2966359 RepID=UPI0021505DAF|nr:DUF5602 domain-containing protein [Nitratireductor sp. ZSWI3]MCR4268816.1 DUF5602 domain-containing protein [Nitratireductor sp. ZSWI3]